MSRHPVTVLFSKEELVLMEMGTLSVMLRICRSPEGRNSRTYSKKGDDLFSTATAFYELFTVFIWSCIESAWTCEHDFTPKETTALLTCYSSLLIAYSHATLLLSLRQSILFWMVRGQWCLFTNRTITKECLSCEQEPKPQLTYSILNKHSFHKGQSRDLSWSKQSFIRVDFNLFNKQTIWNCFCKVEAMRLKHDHCAWKKKERKDFLNSTWK